MIFGPWIGATGVAVGLAAGVIVGVGNIVGIGFGDGVGTAVGTIVGIAVGLTVGIGVGLGDGEILRFGRSLCIGKIAIGIADIHFFTIIINPYGKKSVIYPCVCKTGGTGGRIADFDALFRGVLIGSL